MKKRKNIANQKLNNVKIIMGIRLWPEIWHGHGQSTVVK